MTTFIKRKSVLFVALGLLLAGGVFGWRSFGEQGSAMQYVTAEVERGAIVTSIIGSGSVTLEEEIELKFQTSGKIISLVVKKGDAVDAGAQLAQLDTRELAVRVSIAAANLASSKQKLSDLSAGASAATLKDAEVAVSSALLNLQNAEKEYAEFLQPPLDTVEVVERAMKEAEVVHLQTVVDLEELLEGPSEQETQDASIAQQGAYLAFNETYDDLRSFLLTTVCLISHCREYVNQQVTMMIAFQDWVQGKLYSDGSDSFLRTQYLIEKAERDAAYQILFVSLTDLDDHGQLSIASIQNEITAYETTSAALLTTIDARDVLIAKPTVIERTEAELNVDIAEAAFRQAQEEYATHTGALPRDPLKVEAMRQGVLAAEAKYLFAQEDFDELVQGADAQAVADLRTKVEENRLSLTQAREELASATLKAPIGGVIADVHKKAGDTVGQSDIIVTLISKVYLADIEMNEIDISLVKIGQRATLTFDAVEDVSLTGKVVEIDVLGSSSQGVVTYGAKIAIDVLDERVKPGMTVDAAIIVDSKASVLLVPNAAIQSQGFESVVQILDGDEPRFISVEIGLVNEITTEVTSGLNVGDRVVTATRGGDVDQSTQQANFGSSFRLPGFGGSGGSRGSQGSFGH